MLDAKAQVVCTHRVGSIAYRLNDCPRCLGTGSYYDLSFDGSGHVVMVTDSDKLGQELVKCTLTASNPFHQDYGSRLKSYLGKSVDTTYAQERIRSDVIDVIRQVRDGQRRELAKGKIFAPQELIASVVNVDVTVTDPRKYNVVATLVTNSGSVVPVRATIAL